jgi:hypothetical protein
VTVILALSSVIFFARACPVARGDNRALTFDLRFFGIWSDHGGSLHGVLEYFFEEIVGHFVPSSESNGGKAQD